MRKRAAAPRGSCSPRRRGRRSGARPRSARPRDGARPPMRASSARVCSAQSGAPRRSKPREGVPERRACGGRASSHDAASSRERAASVHGGTDPWREHARRAPGRTARTTLRDRPARRAAAPRQRARIASAQARSSALARSSQRREDAVASSSSPTAISASSRSPSSMRWRGLEHEGVPDARTRASGARARRRHPRATRSIKPSTQLEPDWEMRIPMSSPPAISRVPQRARRRSGPWCAAITATGEEIGRHHAPELGSDLERFRRVPLGLLPVPGPPLEQPEPPGRRGLAVGVAARPVLARAARWRSSACALELESPDELSREAVSRASVERPPPATIARAPPPRPSAAR